MPPPIPVFQGQPAEQTQLLQNLLVKDAFNTFCVDCGKSKSTHFNVTFGTFICEACARSHWQLFDMNVCYIKAVLTENWDKYQLKVAQMFGNKPFFEFMKQYQIQQYAIALKYKTIAVKYYRDRLHHEAAGGVNPEFLRRPVPTIQEGKLTKKGLKAQQSQHRYGTGPQINNPQPPPRQSVGLPP